MRKVVPSPPSPPSSSTLSEEGDEVEEGEEGGAFPTVTTLPGRVAVWSAGRSSLILIFKLALSLSQPLEKWLPLTTT